MSSTVIKVEDLSKQYRLGSVSTGTLSHDLNRWWHTTVRGKEDPYLKIGETNDRTQKGNSDYVWALKDISFNVEQGDVLGIIGRNGAGKSTLLKILSRTTSPTIGNIKIKGRVASLLEVGTGFHPELSGRENIFLNGAILGMSKAEIKRKFDEIVDFAGVERYIDTPVKRYSSGMYVRLAFAVAAHLESEILIVDEVLAVGDAEFQRKCLGKMQDVSKGEGRTVLFVSHNMIALQKICTKGILLTKGGVEDEGEIGAVVKRYISENSFIRTVVTGDSITYNQDKVRLIKAWVQTNENRLSPLISEAFQLNIEFEILETVHINVTVVVFTDNEEHVLSCPSLNEDGTNHQLNPGTYLITCKVPPDFFNTGMYNFSLIFVENYSKVLLELNSAFTMEFEENLETRGNYLGSWGGLVRPKWNWEINKK